VRGGVSEAVTAFAPGRVNLIGEHTDYNGGLALPFAIEQGTTVRATALGGSSSGGAPFGRSPSGGASSGASSPGPALSEIVAVALDLGEEDRFEAGAPAPDVDGWRAFVRGVAAELRDAGVAVRPARIEITGTVPLGAGLSSSASLSVALALAMTALADAGGSLAVGAEHAGPQVRVGESLALDAVALATLCSKVENEWVGARTGLLDQLAVVSGRHDQGVRIDFATLTTEPVPLATGGWTLATVDSGERHSLAAGGYNERRAECEAACERLGVARLSRADPAQAAKLPDPLDRRARHVLEENARVDEAVGALAAGELATVGALLDASHASLRDLYDASTAAVEETVARLRDAGAVGARMVGGGFGGHVLALFPPGVTPPADAMAVRPSAGARVR
jgi:galactokinase